MTVWKKYFQHNKKKLVLLGINKRSKQPSRKEDKTIHKKKIQMNV